MKDYSKYTLRALEVERQKQSRALVLETASSSRERRPPCYEPILSVINQVEEILKKRTELPVRCSLPKKVQRKMGLLPQVA